LRPCLLGFGRANLDRVNISSAVSDGPGYGDTRRAW